MTRRPLLFIAMLCIALLLPGDHHAQSDLLTRINGLRASLGLHPYSIHSALQSAAVNHARWMAQTGKISHQQDDGSGPRTRALQAGYSSSWVSENIYRGMAASADDAWRFWRGSQIHNAAITSPNYNNIGIGRASGQFGNAFVLVFGNSGGGQSTSAEQRAAPPAYVLGINERGHIMHEVQPEDTIGSIALIYGYTWDDIPYMLEINEMTEEDIPRLKIGSVFLVPPKDGTFTPIPATAMPRPTEPPPTVMPSETPRPTATASPIPIREISIDVLPTMPPIEFAGREAERSDMNLPALFGLAIVIQVGIIGGALLDLVRRIR